MPPRRSSSIPADNNEPNYSRIDPAYQPSSPSVNKFLCSLQSLPLPIPPPTPVPLEPIPECDIESCPYLSPSKAGKPVRTVKKTLAFKARTFIRYPTVPHGFPTSVLRNAKRSTRVEPRPRFNHAEVFPLESPMAMLGEVTVKVVRVVAPPPPPGQAKAPKVHPDFVVRKFIDRNMLKWGEANDGADWEEISLKEKPKKSTKKMKQPTPIKQRTPIKQPTPIKQRTPIEAITDGKLLRTIAARKREAAEERANARRLQREEDFLQCEEDFADIIRATPK
jgi:hypothetical protein